MSDMDFERLLAAHNASLKQQYDDAEEFSNWMPDDGEYMVSVIKCGRGVSTKKDPNNPMFWWKPVVRLEAGCSAELIGQDFALGFFNTNAPGVMKGQAKALNGGEPVAFEELDSVFMGAIGKVLRVKVVTSRSQKNGQDYTNCFIQEVIPMQAAEDLPEEPPQSATPAEPVEATVEGETLA
jgi:hypothetical protein